MTIIVFKGVVKIIKHNSNLLVLVPTIFAVFTGIIKKINNSIRKLSNGNKSFHTQYSFIIQIYWPNADSTIPSLKIYLLTNYLPAVLTHMESFVKADKTT